MHSVVGSMIDWYNVQFYNREFVASIVTNLLISAPEGFTEYVTCPSLLSASSETWPNTAVFQIAASGVPLSKIVIGKPAILTDASNGYMDPVTMASCLSHAKDQNWSKRACLIYSIQRSMVFY